MKNILRLLALSLVVTGAVASAHIANASQPSIGSSVSAFPVAGCDPEPVQLRNRRQQHPISN